jgi:UDP-N-acetyl-D-mannosaminuronate dehydrogenase
MLGMSYKPNIGDLRESPCLEILRLLRESGADVAYHDPYIPSLPSHGLASVALSAPEIERADCVVIGTDHDSIDLRAVVSSGVRVVDLRNAVRKKLGHPLPGNVDVL